MATNKPVFYTDKIPSTKDVELIKSNRKTAVKNTGSMSGDKSALRETNKVSQLRDCLVEGSITLKGTFDVNVLDYINLNVYCEDGTRHYVSGLYYVREKVDSIDGGFTTTLKVQRHGRGTDTGAFNTYTLIPGMGPGSVFTGVTTKRIDYGCQVPVIHGSGAGVDVVRLACQYVGNPYVWGGSSLTNGCDCSHFVWLILKATGRDYGYHVSGGWRRIGEEVPPGQAQAGDVMCYEGHVAFYMDSGHIVHARGKAYGIEVTPCDPYKYHNGAITVRRVV